MRPSRRLPAAAAAVALLVLAASAAGGPLFAAATVPLYAVLPLKAGAGVDAATAAAVGDALAGAIARRPGVEVVTRQQLQALLDQEATKQLAGCDDASCAAQLAHALGAQVLVTGGLSKVGTSLLLAVRSVDAETGKGRAIDRRLKGGTLDDVLDALPGVAAEVVSGAPPGAAARSTSSPASVPDAAKTAGGAPSTSAAPRPTAVRDVPYPLDAAARARLALYTDGAGRYVAVDHQAGISDPFFAGTGDALYAQRVYGGGREGDRAWSKTFWDPRAKAPWQAGLSARDGKTTLQCGDAAIALAPVPPKQARAILQAAKVYDVRWQRRLFAAARDDDGTYYVVDVARAPDDARDFRLHVGRTGAFTTRAIDDALIDRAGRVFLFAGGKLALGATPSFVQGGAAQPVVELPVEDVARDVYGRLAVYADPLGTPCDDVFTRR